jgi:hypothetical protein
LLATTGICLPPILCTACRLVVAGVAFAHIECRAGILTRTTWDLGTLGPIYTDAGFMFYAIEQTISPESTW